MNVTGYAMDRLIAELPGTYGLYAFNSKGGSMTNSLTYLAADGSYYSGQTPTRPGRCDDHPQRHRLGQRDRLHGHELRYVTITDSQFFNNALGVALNSRDSEKFPPNEENVLTDNQIFWNNFDAYPRQPSRPTRTRTFAYPPAPA